MGFPYFRWVTSSLTIAFSVMLSNIDTFRTCLDGIEIPTEALSAIMIEVVLFIQFGAMQVNTLFKFIVQAK
jgi:hypothetical protein